MKPRRQNWYLAIILGVGVLASTTPVLSAPVPAPVPARVPAGTPAKGEALLDNNSGSSDALAALRACLFRTNGDYVHVSSSAFEASGHGWWTNINCPSGTLAVVTVQLQEYYSDGTWRNKGTLGRATVRPGGGGGNRATGRAVCNNRGVVSWRSVIDVDLVGLPDDPRKLTTPARNIPCTRL